MKVLRTFKSHNQVKFQALILCESLMNEFIYEIILYIDSRNEKWDRSEEIIFVYYYYYVVYYLQNLQFKSFCVGFWLALIAFVPFYTVPFYTPPSVI